MMVRFTFVISLLSLLSGSIYPANAQIASTNATQWPLHDDGLNKVVQWDHYSFKVNGERLFLFGGEFHYWRYPSPDLWQDLLLKIKAAGFNSFSIYAHWGYHNPNPTTLDFENGAHNFTSILTFAKEVGLYCIFRPGPYVNAESNAGALPLWSTTGKYGSLRNSDARYTAIWKPYFSKLSQIVSEHLITRGGNVILYQIENEYGEQWNGSAANKVPDADAVQYMELLEACARDNGIDVPLIANAPNMGSLSWSKDYSNAGGNVDVVGLDSYPSCWSCNLNECTGVNGAYVAFQTVDYYDYFIKDSNTQPNFLPEFQGGSYNPWGGPEGGCGQNSDADFANLFYRHNCGERVTAMSLYMLYGGTSWGSFAAPVVATSYDYSAVISEQRSIGSKFYETKLLAFFLRVAKDLTVTDRLGNSNSYSTNAAVSATELRNPETNAGFYVTIHANSSSATLEKFQLKVNTSAGLLTVPRFGNSISLNGHQSKILVTDFNFATKSLLYSTAEVLSFAVFDGVETLVLWVPTGEAGEVSVKGAKSGSILSCVGCSKVVFHPGAGELTIGFVQGQGTSVLKLDNGLRIIILDRTTAYRFWTPELIANPMPVYDQTVFVSGPYLVRSVALSPDGKTVLLTGDLDGSTTIQVFGRKSVSKVSWNGKTLATTQNSDGSVVASVIGPDASKVVLPPLTAWKAQDSLPERMQKYNDSGPAWKVANIKKSTNPTKPATLPVLYIDEYGFHNGVHLYRGLFSKGPTGVFLTLYGGTAFGFSAFLNGDFIGSYLGSSDLESASATFSFANATVLAKDNVLLVIQDNTGHDQRSAALNPRGIYNATLLGSPNANFTSWKLAGTAGGESNIDPMRGALAEGGLYAERLGWHLPGYTDSSWTDTTSPSVGKVGAGVTFYRTVVPLNLPRGLDVSLSLVLSSPVGSKLRAQLFVGGYQYGRYTPQIGSQVVFPIPPGVLNNNGDNTIGLSVWAQTAAGAKVDVSWKLEYVHTSSYDFLFNSTELRPAWDQSRLQWK